MNITDTVQSAKVGVTVNLTTQEQIVLKDLVEALSSEVKRTQGKHGKFNLVRLDLTVSENLLTFMSKLTQHVPSLVDTYNNLFDISTEEPNVTLSSSKDGVTNDMGDDLV